MSSASAPDLITQVLTTTAHITSVAAAGVVPANTVVAGVLTGVGLMGVVG
jgi:hypothetical protein